MVNIAILVGNTQYQMLPTLDCCAEDVSAIQELLAATEKFDSTAVILNTESSELKDRVRATIDAYKPIGEIFFYFTGHGFQHDGECFSVPQTLTKNA